MSYVKMKGSEVTELCLKAIKAIKAARAKRIEKAEHTILDNINRPVWYWPWKKLVTIEFVRYVNENRELLDSLSFNTVMEFSEMTFAKAAFGKIQRKASDLLNAVGGNPEIEVLVDVEDAANLRTWSY